MMVYLISACSLQDVMAKIQALPREAQVILCYSNQREREVIEAVLAMGSLPVYGVMKQKGVPEDEQMKSYVMYAGIKWLCAEEYDGQYSICEKKNNGQEVPANDQFDRKTDPGRD